MSERDLLGGRFSDRDYIGRGGFSKVLRCFDHTTRTDVALKMIKEGSDDQREVEILKMIASSRDPRARCVHRSDVQDWDCVR